MKYISHERHGWPVFHAKRKRTNNVIMQAHDQQPASPQINPAPNVDFDTICQD